MTQPEAAGGTTQEHLQVLLDRLCTGDDGARDELIAYCSERLKRQAHHMLGRSRGVCRFEETDDLLQGALMRLYQSLSRVQPETVRGFLALAGEHIRRELIDLFRKHFGAEGLGTNHASVGTAFAGAAGSDAVPLDPENPAPGPQTVTALEERRGRLHEAVDALPEDLREIVHLRYYQELTENQVAGIVGISSRTVRRRWRRARLALHEALKGDEPIYSTLS